MSVGEIDPRMIQLLKQTGLHAGVKEAHRGVFIEAKYE